ncbi:hypothetical protein [Legionella lansingensis]|nr:hypothetical protein [Legionella lansingensis]
MQKKMTTSELVAQIPKEAFILDLTANSLDSCSPDFLNALFLAIPKQIYKIELRLNSLYKIAGKELASAFAGFGDNIRELDLSFNNFQAQAGVEIAKSFNALSHTLVSLNLEGNFLGKKDASELNVIFQSLKHIRALNLSSNCLNLLSLTTLQNLKGSLSQLEKIYLSYTEVASMSLECRLALCEIVSDECKLIFLDDKDKEFDETCESANLIRKIGLKSEIPSLEKQCLFAIKKGKMAKDSSEPTACLSPYP